MNLLAVYVPQFQSNHTCILDVSLHKQTSVLYFVTNVGTVGSLKLGWNGKVSAIQEISFNSSLLSIAAIEDSFQVMVGNDNGQFLETWGSVDMI